MLRDPRRYQKRTKRPAGEGWRGARSEGVGAEKGGGGVRTREKQQERWVEGDECERSCRGVRRNGSDKEERSGREKRRKKLVYLSR